MSIEKVLVEDFEFLIDGDDIAIAIDIDEGMITSAELSYDGRNCAVLVRNNKKAFLLTNIFPGIREKLNSLNDILVLERRGPNHEIMNAYTVEIKHVKEIPYPDNFEKEAVELFEDLRSEIGDEELVELLKSLTQEYEKAAVV